ncbi:hypothetical protein [Streptomyces adelaidensis]|jgi:hypothetical protein|uniref:hypothetical protein n=1 Tax=Streptomyces adelaidensis TaxID=2796465 RepID=UPI0019056783|nr:hypothetical protein [Streptomyces adelaidensis]
MSVDDHKAAAAPATGPRRKRRGRRIVLLVIAPVVVAGVGWGGWSALMPIYQGRDDPYTELPRSDALLDHKDQKAGGLGDALTKQTGYNYPASSWTRWTSNEMADLHLDVRYLLHTATTTTSGRAAAEAEQDDWTAHAENSFIDVEKLSGVGDEAVETWAGSTHGMFVRSGNVSIRIELGAYRVETDSKQHEQIQQTARQLAALAVEDIEDIEDENA